MDKNTAIGFVLIAGVVIGFSYLNKPSSEEIAAREKNDSIAVAQQEANRIIQDSINHANAARLLAQKNQWASEANSLYSQNQKGETPQLLTLKNKNLQVGIYTKGGAIQDVQLLGDYKNQQGENVVLMNDRSSDLTFSQKAKDGNTIDWHDITFSVKESTANTCTLEATTADATGNLTIRYELIEDSYMLNMTITENGMQQLVDGNKLTINWRANIMPQEKGHSFENRYTNITYKESGDDTDNLSENGYDDKDFSGKLDWIGYKDQFFSMVLIGHQGLVNNHMQSWDRQKDYALKIFKTQTQTTLQPDGSAPTQLQFYLGPNDYHLLSAQDKLSMSGKELDLEDLVYLGWPIVRWINKFFIIYLFDWLTNFGLSMGLVLLLLTLIVKFVVYPATKKSFLSSARMRVLKPRVEEIARRYPKQEDALRKQQETMALYREYGVSPMGGCLPMLIQMPIFIALFNFVPNAIQLRGESFLWADDLSAYDAIINFGTDLPLIGDHLSLFCLLFCATNIINTRISMRQQSNQMSSEQEQQMKMMKWMMYLMPIMFFFMFNSYSCGLCYYYFLSGLISILMMWYLRKSTDDMKLLAQLEAYRESHKNDPKKVSSLAARLEALQKKQQEEMERRKNMKK